MSVRTGGFGSCCPCGLCHPWLDQGSRFPRFPSSREVNEMNDEVILEIAASLRSSQWLTSVILNLIQDLPLLCFLSPEWIPAYAGMTYYCCFFYFCHPKETKSLGEINSLIHSLYAHHNKTDFHHRSSIFFSLYFFSKRKKSLGSISPKPHYLQIFFCIFFFPLQISFFLSSRAQRGDLCLFPSSREVNEMNDEVISEIATDFFKILAMTESSVIPHLMRDPCTCGSRHREQSAAISSVPVILNSFQDLFFPSRKRNVHQNKERYFFFWKNFWQKK